MTWYNLEDHKYSDKREEATGIKLQKMKFGKVFALCLAGVVQLTLAFETAVVVEQYKEV